MADYPTVEELQKSITWAIEQGGNDNYILADNSYPYVWGYYLYVVEEQRGQWKYKGVLPVTVAQTRGQLMAFLAGEPQPTADELPKYSIDWDIRNSISGDYCTLKKRNGSIVAMMGSFEFDTAEQGAERWLEQMKDCVVKGLWTTREEEQKMHDETTAVFQAFYDKHCAEGCDCPLIENCEVKWPTGIGLVGCRISEFAKGPEGGYKVHLMTEESMAAAKTITDEIRSILDGE